MMPARVVMGLDPAAGFGWAAYDMDRPPSATESGSLKLEGEILDKIYQLRQQIPALVKQYQPALAVVESPFKFAPQYKKKPKAGLLGVPAQDDAPPDLRKVMGLLRSGRTIHQVAADLRCSLDAVMAAFEATTINPSTISHAGQIAGAATALLLAWNVQVVQSQPIEWQRAIIPKSIYQQFSGPGMAKKRAEATCNMLRIVSPNVDARDAALMAMFAAAHPRLKMMQMRGAA